MAILVKAPWAIVHDIFQLFQGKANGIRTGFRQPNFQAYGCFEEKIQPLIDYVLNYCFWIHAIVSKL